MHINHIFLASPLSYMIVLVYQGCCLDLLVSEFSHWSVLNVRSQCAVFYFQLFRLVSNHILEVNLVCRKLCVFWSDENTSLKLFDKDFIKLFSLIFSWLFDFLVRSKPFCGQNPPLNTRRESYDSGMIRILTGKWKGLYGWNFLNFNEVNGTNISSITHAYL